MIKSKKDLYFYLEADRIAKSRVLSSSLKTKIKEIIFPDLIWKFQKTMRWLEYYSNCKKGLLDKLQRIYFYSRFRKLSIKLGFSISINTFGPGLSIAHYGMIVINKGAKIGANCRIHSGVNIGTMAGYSDKAPRIGNNCYIGPGVKIYGDISVGNNIAFGANAVVNKTFTEENILLAGVPAKKIKVIDIYDLLIPATELMELNLNREELYRLPANEINSRFLRKNK